MRAMEEAVSWSVEVVWGRGLGEKGKVGRE